MALTLVSQMSPEDLERILKYLPRPGWVEVSLFGDYDFSGVIQQAKEASGVEINDMGGTLFNIIEPSNEKVLAIYRNFNAKDDPSKVTPDVEIDYMRRGVYLHRATWALDSHASVDVTPTEVKIKYRGDEPTLVAQLRQELAGSSVRLEIKVNKF